MTRLSASLASNRFFLKSWRAIEFLLAHRNSASTKRDGVSNEKEFHAQTFLDSIAVSIHQLASKAGNLPENPSKTIA